MDYNKVNILSVCVCVFVFLKVIMFWMNNKNLRILGALLLFTLYQIFGFPCAVSFFPPLSHNLP